VEKWLGILGLTAAIFAVTYQYNKKFLDWVRFQSIGTRDYIVEKLGVMFIEVDPQHVLIALFGASFGLGAITFLLMIPNYVPGLMLAGFVTTIGWKIPKPIVQYLYNKRIEKFNLQMIDALSLMSNGMKSGLSVIQSIGIVVQEMPDPIRQEFNLILSQNKLGVTVEEAFINLANRIESDDVEMFVTSINILKETGGNLAETFDTIVLTIRDRIKVEGKIRAMMAQSYSQGMVLLGVPPMMMGLLYTSDPEFIAPMFTNPIGWGVIILIAILEIVAFGVIKKLVKIEV
tara:strand:+ start:2114 stop:2977 length:864 start_codon:yes stop_codon:yes gene_type:complete